VAGDEDPEVAETSRMKQRFGFVLTTPDHQTFYRVAVPGESQFLSTKLGELSP
jgi:hypothetical protein